TDDTSVLLVLDEGDPALVVANLAIATEECRGGEELGNGPVEHWFESRNDVAALEQLISGGLVVDTMEITGSWRQPPAISRQAIDDIKGVEGTLSAGAHQSHAYVDGACLYFTFAGKVGDDPAAKDTYYRTVWDAGTRAVLAHGGAL